MSFYGSRSQRSSHSKHTARKARGEPMICTCGAQTFANHMEGHMKHHHAHRMNKNVRRKSTVPQS
jgi:adenosyl cobinamide kinase/adenosyl cobinamide phosphate guanylyltransferase